MHIISQVLSNKQKQSNCSLIPFITAGYPNLETTIDALYILSNKGADAIELGIPYSDALADGPIIQNSSKVALNKGVHIDQILSLLSLAIPNIRCPIIIFSYYNPILARGVDKFIEEISSCGVKGLIIPDLPIEETDYIIYLCEFYKIELILFIAPTSSYTRIQYILSKSPGCLYIVSNTGVTGLRENVDNSIKLLCKKVKADTDKLIMLGFGISNRNQAHEISQWDIDGIVMGSAFINILSKHKEFSSISEVLQQLGSFCMDIKKSILSNQ